MSKRTLKTFCAVVFAAYLLLLIRLIVFKFPPMMTAQILSGWSVGGLLRHIRTANLTPFHTIGRVLLYDNRLHVELRTLLYNVLAFIPLGILLPCLTEKARRWSRILVAGLALSLTLELFQLITILGEADVDDILLNTTGALLGYGLFKVASTFYHRLSST